MTKLLPITKEQKRQGTKRSRPGIVRVILLCAFAPLFLCAEEIRFASPSNPQSDARGFSVNWVPDPANPTRVEVEVTGLDRALLDRLRRSNWKPPQWRQLLAVYAHPGDSQGDPNLPPMLGAYSVEANSLRFMPQFPLEPGIKYRAVFRPDRLPIKPSDSAPVVSVYELPPGNSAPTTVVARVYPSADLLPENLLKFYIHFSAPMSRGNIYDHIHLFDAEGKEIELPFLEIDEELWDSAMTRLTLFIDPGRIKRGVLPLEEIGPSLEEGKSYALAIDSAWRDASGNPLRESFRKEFRVGPADREPPDPSRWKIEPPLAATREPLVVIFPEPMEHALTQRLIAVAAASGGSVAGKTELEDSERRWKFTPDEPWSRGSHKLAIQTTIEDLAGNNIGKPFEVDLFEGVQKRITTTIVDLPFEIR
jgi:hypothetical protein